MASLSPIHPQDPESVGFGQSSSGSALPPQGLVHLSSQSRWAGGPGKGLQQPGQVLIFSSYFTAPLLTRPFSLLTY